MKKAIKNNYIFGTLLVSVLFLLYLAMYKIVPFGNVTILRGDSAEQYVNFFCFLKQIIVFKKSIIMPWNFGIVNGFYCPFTYYLMNPINIIILFFNTENMYICLELITYIKIVLAFNTIILYFEKVWDYKKADIILFGLGYAFSSFVITNMHNIMWLDAVYILPIALLFIEKYIDDKKILPLIITYVYAICVQYYMAYNMIIFCSIYFVFRFIIKNTMNKENVKLLIKKLVILFLITLLCVGITMFIYLPNIMQLNSLFNVNIQILEFKEKTLSDLINVFSNKNGFLESEKVGFYFSNSLVLILIPLFFLNKKIKLKEKLCYLIFYLIMLLPIISPVLYRLWHAGSVNNMCNFRFGYTTVFLLILIAFIQHKNKQRTNRKDILFSIEIFFSIIIFELIINYEGLYINNYYYAKQIAIQLIIIILLCVAYYKLINSNKNKWKYVISLIVILEVVIVFSYNSGNGVNVQNYNKYKNIVDEIKNINVDDNRIALFADPCGNLSLRYNYKEQRFFSSGVNDNYMNMTKLGYDADRVVFYRRWIRIMD